MNRNNNNYFHKDNKNYMFNPNNNMFNQNTPFYSNNMNASYNLNNMNINNYNNNFNINNATKVQNFTQPSNLRGRAQLVQKNNNEYLVMRFLLNNNDYILDLEEKIEYNSIYFTCRLKEDITLLYEYSCIKTFEELKNLNQHFKGCDNIKQIFNVFKKFFLEHKSETKPRIDLMNDMIILYFISPSFSGKYEDTTIILGKKQRKVEDQFSKLQCEYVELLYNFKEIQKIAWDSVDKDELKVKKIQEICGKPEKNDS